MISISLAKNKAERNGLDDSTINLRLMESVLKKKCKFLN